MPTVDGADVAVVPAAAQRPRTANVPIARPPVIERRGFLCFVNFIRTPFLISRDSIEPLLEKSDLSSQCPSGICGRLVEDEIEQKESQVVYC